jgi:putative flavoprotein involved in K+ transport
LVTVEGVDRYGDRSLVTCDRTRIEADNVVVASGTWQEPKTPGFAGELAPAIRQLHSNDYRNRTKLQDGPVLGVGASHSGADIALDVSGGHHTILCGPVRGKLPFDIEGRAARRIIPILWPMANHVLTERTPIGRKMRGEVRAHGGPLLRVKCPDLDAAGVRYLPSKVAGVSAGKPLLEDGTVLDVANVVWCTGFGKDLSWIHLDITGADGWPDQHQGCATAVPGLYFVGLPFLQAFASMLVGGAGRDTEYVARHITARRPAVQAQPA